MPVRFVCDWVLHSNLARSQWAKELLTHADAVVGSGQSWNSFTAGQDRFFQENFTLEGVRESLMNFLRDQRVRPRTFGNIYQWRAFMKHLSGVVADCPLILKGGKLVKQVQLQIVGVADLELHLEWTFEGTGGTVFQLTAPVVLEESDGIFGRG